MRARFPENEDQRLAALRHYNILDTPPEEAFDALALTAARLFDAPIALVSLVDENRQWLKSRLGIEVCETARDVAFCAHAILTDEPTVVPDARADERFRDNPLVTGEPGIRFYAGAPLCDPQGARLGTLCVIDMLPRPHPSPSQIKALQDLAGQVVDQLQLRRARIDLLTLDAALQQREHDLKVAERAMRISQRRAQLAMEMGNMGSWELDGATGRAIWSDGLCRLFDIPEGSFKGGKKEWLALVHPEDRARVEDKVSSRARRDLVFKYRIQRRDGQVRWLEERCAFALASNGRVNWGMGVAYDVTDRELAEQSIRQSEKLFRDLSVSCPLGIFRANLDGQVTYANPRAYEIFEMTEMEALGDGWTRRIHPEDLKSMVQAWGDAIGHGVDYAYQYRLLMPDGTVKHVFGRATIECDSAGNSIGTLGTLDDITHEVRQEQERERLLSERSAVLQCVATGMLGFDTEGRCTFLNAKAALMLGRTEAECIGQTVSDVLAITDERGRSVVLDLQSKHEVHCDHHFFSRADGTRFPAGYHGSPLVVEDHVQGFVFSFLDITERKRAERERAELLRRLNAAVQEIGQVQTSMLASTPRLCSLKLDLCFHPKHAAGGDFLCHYKLPDGREVVLLTDVSGHDLRAAYHAAHSHGMVRAMLDHGISLDGVFQGLNRALLDPASGQGKTPISISACAFVFDEEKMEILVRNSGSPSPIYVADNGTPETIETSGSFPLGWFEDLISMTNSRKVRGGSVLVWTDGLEDLAFQMQLSPLTVAVTLLRSKAEGVTPMWIKDAQDDIMAACITLPGNPEELVDRWIPLLDEHYGREMSREIDVLQANWTRNLEFAIPGIRDAALFDVVLCTREAVLNALTHGCLNGGSARLLMRFNSAVGRIIVRVEDPGKGHLFDVHQHEGPDLLDSHRGLFLIRQFATRVTTERDGAVIDMEFDVWATSMVCGEQDFDLVTHGDSLGHLTEKV